MIGELEAFAEPEVAFAGIEGGASDLKFALDVAVRISGLVVVDLVAAEGAESLTGDTGLWGGNVTVGVGG